MESKYSLLMESLETIVNQFDDEMDKLEAKFMTIHKNRYDIDSVVEDYAQLWTEYNILRMERNEVHKRHQSYMKSNVSDKVSRGREDGRARGNHATSNSMVVEAQDKFTNKAKDLQNSNSRVADQKVTSEAPIKTESYKLEFDNEAVPDKPAYKPKRQLAE